VKIETPKNQNKPESQPILKKEVKEEKNPKIEMEKKVITSNPVREPELVQDSMKLLVGDDEQKNLFAKSNLRVASDNRESSKLIGEKSESCCCTIF